MVDIPQGADIERMTAEAAAQAEAMLAALDLEQVQRDTIEAAQLMERELSDHEQP